MPKEETLEDRLDFCRNMTRGTMPIWVMVSNEGDKIKGIEYLRGKKWSSLITILVESDKKLHQIERQRPLKSIRSSKKGATILPDISEIIPVKDC